MISNIQTNYVNYVNTVGKQKPLQKQEGKTSNVPEEEGFQPLPRFGFLNRFIQVGFDSSNSPMTVVENLARKYYEIRNELLEKYQGDENTLYKMLGELNSAFERILLMEASSRFPSTLQLEPSSSSANSTANAGGKANDALASNYTEEGWHIRTADARQILQQNVFRNRTSFFEKFIYRIQNQDFQDAFNSSWTEAVSDRQFQMNPLSFTRVQVNTGDSTVFLFVSSEGIWRLPEGGGGREDLKLIDSAAVCQGLFHRNRKSPVSKGFIIP